MRNNNICGCLRFRCVCNLSCEISYPLRPQESIRIRIKNRHGLQSSRDFHWIKNKVICMKLDCYIIVEVINRMNRRFLCLLGKLI